MKRTYSARSNALFVLDGIREYDKSLLSLALINAVFSAVLQFVPVLMPKLVVDELIGKGRPGRIILIVLVISIVTLVSQSISRLSSNSIGNRFIMVRLRFIARTGWKFMTTDFQALENPDVLDLSNKGKRACDNNNDGIEGVMHRLLSMATKLMVLVGSGAIITTLHPLMIMAIGALLTVNYLIGARTRRFGKQVDDELAPVQRKLNYIRNVMSNFAYGKDIRLFGMKNLLVGKYAAEQERRLAGVTKTQKAQLISKNIYACTSMAQEVLLYGWVCWRVLNGSMGVGSFLMYIAAVQAFSSALGVVLDDISHIQLQNEVISDYRSFLDYPDAGSTGSEKIPENLGAQGCTFTFENVSFRYPGQTEYALQDVSLQINAGERLAIVGLNGAGKTTFVKLLARLYEPESGRILLNGVDVRSYDKHEYYKLFSVVFQDIQLFAYTIAENVSMAEYDKIDMAEVRSCLARAGLGDKMASLPKGVDTAVLKVIEEDGVEFSGGESQKLALARALYKNAPIVVLDEPTSALDALAEERLYHDFDTLIGRKTAIYISHRLASTRFCDRVAMFVAGRIVEVGSHDELMERGGRYGEVFAMQAKYYYEEACPA